MAKRLVACLDVRHGRVVKGVRFQDLKDQGDPAELAAAYARQGADEIVVLDIAATLESRPALLGAVTQVAQRLFIPLTVGGGVRSEQDAHELLRAGADKVAVNTAAVKDPELLTRLHARYGAQCVVLAIDAQREGNEWLVRTHAAREGSPWRVVEWAKEGERRGAGEILLTSIDRDGTRSGYDLELTRRVAEAVNIPVVASGGAGSVQHVVDVLTQGRAEAALLAGTLHEGVLTIPEVKRALQGTVEVRP